MGIYVVILHLVLALYLANSNSLLRELLLYGELVVMIKSVWDSMFSEDIMANVFGAGIAAGAILLYFSRSTTTRIFPL